MSFLSQGDYLFPFDFTFYWIKHFFVWSYQTGAANPDGIIRFPARLLNFVVFGLTDNIFISYFYLALSMLIIFASFYVFASHFLNVKDRRIKLLASVFFACNPIFLGYLAKVGLIVGVAMLPLCLVVIRYAFAKNQFRYLILFLLLLNVSLVHPFTFTINLVVSGIYFLKLLTQNNTFISKNKLKTLGLAIVGGLMSAYFILPIAALGTVSKTVLSEEISNIPVDYAALVDFANTGDPLTALSLSKNVFLDFEYFNLVYEPIYFVAAFAFVGLLFGLYVKNEKLMKREVRGTIVLLFGLFLVLLILSMATFMEVNRLIKIMISMPGGWMFRSPLKWQLYIPFILGAIMCLLLVHTPRKMQKWTLISFAVTIALMGGFLTFDIYRKLFVPRDFKQVAQLAQADLHQKNLLFVNDGNCFEFLQNNPSLVTELNQLFISRNLQVKRIKSASVKSVNLRAYDFVMGCRSTLAFPMQKETTFHKKYSFADDAMDFYENASPRPYIYALDQTYDLPKTDNLSDKARFANGQGREFDFVTDSSNTPTSDLQDPFESIKLENIQDDKIVTESLPAKTSPPILHANDQEPKYYRVDGDRVTLSGQPEEGFEMLPDTLPLESFAGKSISFAYLDKQRSRQNLISNPSFEEGLWQEKVWDCYAYDNQPVVHMSLNEKDSNNGRKSLELAAKRHIACSGPSKIALKPNARYLLHFAYKSVGGSFAGYQVTFDDEHRTSVSDYLPAKENEWTDFSREIEVPPGAKHMELVVYGRQGSAGTDGIARYDDFGLYEIPDLQGKFYVTSPPVVSAEPPQVEFVSHNPAKKTVRVTGAKDGFFIAMRDTYHPGWQLLPQTSRWLPESANQTLPGATHLKANGFMNMWYVDAHEACENLPNTCQTNADGTYNLDLAVEFAPQRWFHAGLIISGVTFTGIAAYFAYLGIRLHKRGGVKLWRLQ